ncbi:beta-1,3-galactosyltransferase 1-like [Gigantopelta aegis]|uniref:beta-1,3-galactosyltransferase 1-like n=1 Tax=Gigantopelta aegis TaxID=1735272 RepID=UPI001B88BCF7|nr:beta-1,3-galactosyltransferase 1-like [Gigantopelta aegis]
MENVFVKREGGEIESSMAVYLCERFYTRSWLCLGLLFIVCIGVNMIVFWSGFRIRSFNVFSKSHLHNRVEAIASDKTDNIPPESVELTETFPPVLLSLSNKTNSTTSQNIVPHDFKYVINEPDTCRSPPILIIIVCTAVKNYHPRVGVRSTWGSPEHLKLSNSKLVFLVGRVNSPFLQEKLENESKLYSDIVQADFVDSYQNLSIKSVVLLNWAKTYCAGSRFVLKADDDMYVNVPNLLKDLVKMTPPKFIMGHIFQGAKPIQDKRSKWYTPLNAFSEKVYPKYVSGTTYAMTTNSAADLYKASLEIKTFWLEDVYITGLLARKAGIPRFHNPKFNYITTPTTGCFFKDAITGHRYYSAELFKIHRELYSANLTCKT